jgi:hypothetical protein
VPGFAVSVPPVVAEPEIVGSELFDGATVARVVTAAAVPTATRAATSAAVRARRRLRSLSHVVVRRRVIEKPPGS